MDYQFNFTLESKVDGKNIIKTYLNRYKHNSPPLYIRKLFTNFYVIICKCIHFSNKALHNTLTLRTEKNDFTYFKNKGH